MSKSRAKGTGEETATVNDWNAEEDTVIARRMPASSLYDIRVEGWGDGPPLEVLTIRADRGERLAVIRHSDLRKLYLHSANEVWDTLDQYSEIHEEVKRYRTFAISTIFQKKFG